MYTLTTATAVYKVCRMSLWQHLDEAVLCKQCEGNTYTHTQAKKIYFSFPFFGKFLLHIAEVAAGVLERLPNAKEKETNAKNLTKGRNLRRWVRKKKMQTSGIYCRCYQTQTTTCFLSCHPLLQWKGQVSAGVRTRVCGSHAVFLQISVMPGEKNFLCTVR